MTDDLTFSIILPTCFRQSIWEVIMDLAHLNRDDYEVIVIGDGNNPEFLKELESMTDDKWTIIHTKRTGAYGNHQRDEGIKIAKGKYCVFLGDDDKPYPWLLDSYYVEELWGDVDVAYAPSLIPPGTVYRAGPPFKECTTGIGKVPRLPPAVRWNWPREAPTFYGRPAFSPHISAGSKKVYSFSCVRLSRIP